MSLPSNPLTDPLFLSVADLKQLCPVSDAVGSGAPLLQCIRGAQNQYVAPYLGPQYYAQLVAEQAAYIAVPSTPFPAATATILEMLKAMQAWYAYKLWLTQANAQSRPVGVVKLEGQNTSSADLQWITTQINAANNAAETYKDKLTCYMLDNSSDYPLFANNFSLKGGPRNGMTVIAPPLSRWNLRPNFRRPW